MLDSVIELAEINSSSYNKKGIEAVCEWFENAYQELHPDQMERVLFENGPGLQLHKRQAAPIQIFLGGHLDTVFQKTSSFQTVTKGSNNRIIGPGVTDMKGGLIVMLEGLKAFEKHELAKQIGWRIFLNPDEELGSPYSATTIQTFAKGVDCGLIFEPTLPDGSMIRERKGSVNYHASFQGKAAHLGRCPHEGKCAITPMVAFLEKVTRLNAPKRDCIVGVGKMQGGQAANQVAQSAEASINVRSWNEKDFDRIDRKLKKLASTYDITLQLVTKRPVKLFDAKTQKLFETYADAIGGIQKLQTSGGVCDGNLLAEIDIPTIDTMGVIGGKIHTTEEYLEIDSLEEKSSCLTRFLLHLAKGKENGGYHGFSSRQTRS